MCAWRRGPGAGGLVVVAVLRWAACQLGAMGPWRSGAIMCGFGALAAGSLFEASWWAAGRAWIANPRVSRFTLGTGPGPGRGGANVVGEGSLRTVSGAVVCGAPAESEPSLARMSRPRTVEARASGPLSLVALAAGAGPGAEVRASASVPLEPMVARGVVFPLIVDLGAGEGGGGGPG